MHGISVLVLLLIFVSVAAFKVHDADFSIDEAEDDKVKPSKLKNDGFNGQDIGVKIHGGKKRRNRTPILKQSSISGPAKAKKIDDSLESDKPKDSRRSKGKNGKYNVDNDKYHEVGTHFPNSNNRENRSRDGRTRNPRNSDDRRPNDQTDDVKFGTTESDKPSSETSESPEPDLKIPENSGRYGYSSFPVAVNARSTEDSDDDDDDDDEITSTTDIFDSDETVVYEVTSSHKNREKVDIFNFDRVETTSTSEEPITDSTVEFTDYHDDNQQPTSHVDRFVSGEKLSVDESERSEDCNRIFKALNLCDFYKSSQNLFYRVILDLRHRPQ
uniref:Dentin sialophosphoprotein-like n=1 Tax=Panagrellus redivivus TaxID=6233 RepID=A0A7E4VMR3_PANRE